MSVPPNGRLDGWKAISAYLAREQRTVQRWHKERGMPVHHVPGGKRGAVFADRGELDAWLHESSETDGRPNAPASAGSRAVFIPTEAGESTSSPSTSPALRAQGGHRRRRLLASTAALAGLLLGGAALLAVTWSGSSVNVDRLELRSGRLTGLDKEGWQLWSLALPPIAGQAPREVGFSRSLSFTAPLDLDGDGTREWLASVKSADRDDFYHLSSTGQLRWSFTLNPVFSFAGQRFNGPWRVNAYFPGPSPHAWIAIIDHTWWPSFLVRVGVTGEASVAFVNAGHIESIRRLSLAEKAYILAGGVNNEYRSAALAVLDEDGLAASSPQSVDSPFACDNCPTGTPRRYLLFPRSEVSAALGEPYNFAQVISGPGTDGRVEVSVREVSEPPQLRSLYRLSGDLVPESVAMSDRYWERHRELSLAGKLDHGPENCPERIRGVVVRMWQPDTGWNEIAVPPSFPIQGPT